MTIPENIYTIILIAAVVALFAVYIVGLIKNLKAGPTMKRTYVLALTVGFLLCVYLVLNAREMTPAAFGQSILMLALVLVTGFYALSAYRQADASVKMAKEMGEQRYDAVRPVIDIQKEESPDAHISEGLAAMFEDTSRGLSCILHNIGLGPAIDVHSFVQPPKGDRWCRDFGTLAIGGRTEPLNLSLNQEGDRTALVAYYKDVYGRAFESSREVSVDKTRGLEVGPLQIRLVREDENHD